MMREILFRGKTTENRWVEGTYFKHDTVKVCFSSDDPKPRHLIIQDGFCDWGFEPPIHCVDVAPDTVGQFTGLTDKNGKKIFEGDIIRYNTFNDFDCHSVVKFGEYEQDGSAGEYNPRDCIGWYVEVDNFTCPDWAEDDPIYFNDYLKQQNLLEVSDECEIIGNIHDNPELLEVSGDG